MSSAKKKNINDTPQFGLYRAPDEVKIEGRTLTCLCVHSGQAESDLFKKQIKSLDGMTEPASFETNTLELGPIVVSFISIPEGSVKYQKSFLNVVELCAIQSHAVSLRLCNGDDLLTKLKDVMENIK